MDYAVQKPSLCDVNLPCYIKLFNLGWHCKYVFYLFTSEILLVLDIFYTKQNSSVHRLVAPSLQSISVMYQWVQTSKQCIMYLYNSRIFNSYNCYNVVNYMSRAICSLHDTIKQHQILVLRKGIANPRSGKPLCSSPSIVFYESARII